MARKCNACGQRVPRKLERCRNCGTYWTRSWRRAVLAFVIAMSIVAIVLWMLIRYGPERYYTGD